MSQHFWNVLLLWFCVSNVSPLTTDITGTGNDVTNTSEVTDKEDPNIFPHRTKLRHVIILYIVPIIVISGTIGNVLSFIIYSRPSFRNSMTSFLFRVLAVVDTIALNYGTWDNWLKYVLGKSLFVETRFHCMFSTYLRYLLPDLAVWVLVLVSLERVIGVSVPHRARLILTKTRLNCALVFIFIFLICFNVPMMISMESQITMTNGTATKACILAPKYLDLTYNVLPWMDLVIYALLPLLIMSISSSIIITIVVKRKKVLESIRSKSSDTNTLTITLLTVCFVFMLLTLPHAFYSLLVGPLWQSHKDRIDFYSWRFLAGLLRYVNNAINFLLYCMSGRPFRQEFRQLFCCWKNQKKRKETYTSATQLSVVSQSTGSFPSNNN